MSADLPPGLRAFVKESDDGDDRCRVATHELSPGWFAAVYTSGGECVLCHPGYRPTEDEAIAALDAEVVRICRAVVVVADGAGR